jgi:hypothetical protein
MSAFVESIGTWFGFVGSCVASPTGACIPFLAFLALGVAAGAAFAGVVIAYRAGFKRLSRFRGTRLTMRLPGEPWRTPTSSTIV